MRHLANVLNKVFVREFFRMNSGFFLLVATLTFGFMSEVEHVALAQFFVSSHAAMFIPIGVWALFGLKIVAFNNNQLHTDEIRFVFNIQFLPSHQQFLLSALVFFLQFLPAIIYGVFLIVIACKVNAFETAVIIPITLVVLWCAFSLYMARILQNPFYEHRISFLKRFLDAHYIRSAIHLYIEGILRKWGLMIGGTKLFTGCLLFGVCMLYRYEPYDGRLLAMALTVCGMANAIVIFRLVRFEHIHLAWMKNMPIASWKRFFRLAIAAGVFVMPEAVILIRNYPANIDLVFWLIDVLYLLSLGALFVGYFHSRAASVEHFTRGSFLIFIGFIIMILFRAPILSLIIFNFLVGFLLFRRGYYSLEISE